jgi:hypothetical protein
MSKITIAFLTVFALSCVGIFAAGSAVLSESQTAQAAAPLASPTAIKPTATATPAKTMTPVPSPTADARIVALQTSIAVEQAALNVESTRQVLAIGWSNATGTAAVATATAIQGENNARMTQEAGKVALNATATVYAAYAGRDAAKAAAEAQQAQAWAVALPIVAVLVALMAFVTVRGVLNVRAQEAHKEAQEAYREAQEVYNEAEKRKAEREAANRPEPVRRVLVTDGATKGDYAELPCSDEEMTALADGVINGGKSLAVGQWEGESSPFTRNSFLPVRYWLRARGFAEVGNKPGEIVLNDSGRAFLRGWLETSV